MSIYLLLLDIVAITMGNTIKRFWNGGAPFDEIVSIEVFKGIKGSI